MFAAMGWNVLGITSGTGESLAVDAFGQFNVEMNARDALIENFGLAGFLAFYFVYDIDFTVSRLVLSAIRPDISPFLW